MSLLKYTHKCRVCGNPNLKDFLHLGDQHIQGAFVTATNNPPQRKVKSIICRCDVTAYERACGLVQNRITIAPEILYSSYFYRSSISATMKSHLSNIAAKVKKIIDIPGQIIVDIGGNDGYLLQQFDFCKKILVDPSDVASTVRGDTHVINECFPSDTLNNMDITVDIFTSIACFYDIENPAGFVSSIREQLSENGIWVCEFAYLPSVWENLAYDGMVHEHVALYSLTSFEYVLKLVELKIFDIEINNINGGSLQVWVTHEKNKNYDTQEGTNRILKQKIREFDLQMEEEQFYYDFALRVSKHQDEFVKLLHQLKAQGKKIHIYGSSTKLNCLLGVSNIGPALIDMAAERDPVKWGAKTLSGIPIVSEEESRKLADVYIVGPYHFMKEMLSRERDTILTQNKTFIFPLPKILEVNAENYHVVSQSIT